jgi:hypothetical protein
MDLQVSSSSKQKEVHIHPNIWKQYEFISKVLPDPATSYSRNNLKQLVTGAFRDNDPQLINELFVKRVENYQSIKCQFSLIYAPTSERYIFMNLMN